MRSFLAGRNEGMDNTPPFSVDEVFDFSLLRGTDGRCKLCWHDKTGHDPRCPGRLCEPDRVLFQMSFTYGGCSRGCCSSYRATVTGKDVESLAADYVAVVGDESEGRREQVTLAVNTNGLFKPDRAFLMRFVKARDFAAEQLETAKEAREAAERLQERREEYVRSLVSLEEERTDLTPEAYERRLAELKESYKDVRDLPVKTAGGEHPEGQS